jgi:hypothetical protein
MSMSEFPCGQGLVLWVRDQRPLVLADYGAYRIAGMAGGSPEHARRLHPRPAGADHHVTLAA